MKTVKKSFIALMATLAVGTAAVAGLAFGLGNAADGALRANADTVAEEETAKIVFGENNLKLEADTPVILTIDSVLSGIYGFEWQSGNATFTFGGIDGSYGLNAESAAFEVEISSPQTTEVAIVSAEGGDLSFLVTYSVEYTDLVIGENALELKADKPAHCIIGGEGTIAPAGYYTFTRTAGSATLDLSVNGKLQAVTLTRTAPTVTVFINSPASTVISVYWTADITFGVTVTYSETDPAAPDVAALKVGENVVKATGDGAEYTFTAPEAGTYALSSESLNAYVMVEKTYSDPDFGTWTDWEWIELFTAEYDNFGNIEKVTGFNSYEFTVLEGERVNFLMATNDWNDDTYTVTLVKKA